MRALAIVFQFWLTAACTMLSDTQLTPEDIRWGRAAPARTLQQDVDTLIQPLAVAQHTPAIIAGIAAPGEGTQFFGFGRISVTNPVPPTPDTLFAIGSISKGFVAAATEALVTDGRLDWRAPVAATLPEWREISADARQMTLLQLASHTSGLARQPYDPRTMTLFLRYLVDGLPFYDHIDAAYVRNYLRDVSLVRQEAVRYSNIGYGVLSAALERNSGISTEELVHRRLIAPLRLSCTGYVPTALPCASRAAGHAGDQPKLIPRGQPAPDWTFTPLLRSSAGLYSTARDLLAYGVAHFSDNDAPAPTILRQLLARRVPLPDQQVPVAWNALDVDGVTILYQVGFVGGYSSFVGLVENTDIAVVVLQNSFNWDLSRFMMLLHALYRRQACAAAPHFNQGRAGTPGMC